MSLGSEVRCVDLCYNALVVMSNLQLRRRPILTCYLNCMPSSWKFSDGDLQVQMVSRISQIPNETDNSSIGFGFAHKTTKEIIWVSVDLIPLVLDPRFSKFNRKRTAFRKILRSLAMSGVFHQLSTLFLPDPSTYIRSIGRDPQYFSDPEKFDPQRWISEDRQVREELKFFPFGFGRR